MINKYLSLLPKNTFSKLFLLLGVTICSILMNGYKFNSTDLSLYISYLPLYENRVPYHPEDLLMIAKNTGSHYYTFGWYLVLPFIKFITIPWFLFGFHILLQFLIFLTFFQLAKTIWDEPTAWIAVLIFMSQKMVGQTVSTLENTFSVRSIALILHFLALRLYLLKRNHWSFFIIGLSGNIHLLSAAIVFLILFLTYTWEYRFKKITQLFIYIILFIFGLLPVIIWRIMNYQQGIGFIPLQMDPVWLEIVHIRAPYLFASLWDLKGQLYLGILFLTLCILYMNKSKMGALKSFEYVTYSSVVFTLLAMGMTEFNIPIAITFQLTRSVWFLFYFILLWIARYIIILLNQEKREIKVLAGILFLSYFAPLPRSGVLFSIFPLIGIWCISKSYPIRSKYLWIMIMVGFLIMVSLGTLYLSHYDLSHYQTKMKSKIKYHLDITGNEAGADWINIQKWIKSHVSEKSFLITPPDKFGFRVWSERSPVVENKDGAMSVYNIKYAKEWYQRIMDFHIQPKQNIDSYATNYDSLNEESFRLLSKKYDTPYILVRRYHLLDFELLYENDSYALYLVK